MNIWTVAELRRALLGLPEDTPIFMASDEEQNQIHSANYLEVIKDDDGTIRAVLLVPTHE